MPVLTSTHRSAEVTAAGVPQPALADPGNQVAKLAAQLTHTSLWQS
jgi:hypothetical protein